MKAILSLIVGAVAASVKATDTPSAPDNSTILPNGYTLIPFYMKGAIEPGGEEMMFNGTVTDIFDQIQSIKPDFKWDDFQSSQGPTGGHHLKRSKQRISCIVPGYEASFRVGHLMGYDYLKTINQPCYIDGGPRKCAVIFCHYGQTIWMCNDNTDSIVRDCGFIASYVLDLIGEEECVSPGSMGPGTWLLGQEFDTEGFNVIAGGQDGC
ncbi:hypothetical protein F4677DRAFT_463709 [Hypoxylon crocopeplum]|nr:hypothetical protein F4677DRAFT_463709 [Hypoxylon crocopeplum]